MDDVNYLLHRRQVSLVLAERAACEESRHAHRELANRYAALIHDHRDGTISATRAFLAGI